MQVFYGTDLNIREYDSSAPEGDERRGRVTWQKYPSTFPGLDVRLCDVVRKVAPVVAGHLGGPRTEATTPAGPSRTK